MLIQILIKLNKENIMYYHRLFRKWVIDGFDIFLLSAILGGLVASHLKQYLSEKQSIERLKKSMIEKSKLQIQSKKAIPNSKEMRIKKVYKLALQNRGGQLDNLPQDLENARKAVQLAEKIRKLVENFAIFLKRNEMKGIFKILFKNGRLLLELLLTKYNIQIYYQICYIFTEQGLNTQIVVWTSTMGGLTGFTLSWFSVGAWFVTPPVLISILSLRSFAQQIINNREYNKVKKIVFQALNDPEIKKRLETFFDDFKIPKSNTNIIKMKYFDSDKTILPEFNFESDQTLEGFLKDRLKDELGLLENPNPKQLQEIIRKRKINLKPKGKTVYFKDFIRETAENSDNIIDAEIIKESISIKVKNQEL